MPDGDVKDFGAIGDGVTDDTNALRHAIEILTTQGVAPELYFRPGAYRIRSAIKFPPSVTLRFAAGGRLHIDRGVIATINAAVATGRRQIFSGLGQVNFRDHAADDFSPLVDTAYPEWWGALPGNGGPTTLDCSPGVQAAFKSGAQRISFGEGLYKFLSTVTFEESAAATDAWIAGSQYKTGDRRVRNDISFRAVRDHRASVDTEPGSGIAWEGSWTLGSPGDLQIEGTSRSGSYLLAGKAVLAAPPAPNALFINDQSNGKLSFHRIRFQGIGGVSVFRGFALYAHIPIVSGSIDDCWIAMGDRAAGFFFGALNNYRVSNCVFEGSPPRFTIAGSGMADVQFVNNVDYLNHGPFLDMAGEDRVKNMVTVTGLHAQTLQSGVLIRADNCRNLRVTDVSCEISGTIPGTVGLLELKNCTAARVSSLTARRVSSDAADMGTVIRIDGGSTTIDNILVDGGAVHLAVRGANDLRITASQLLNASAFSVQLAGTVTGTVVFTGCRLQSSGDALIKHEGTGHTHDLVFNACDLLDAGRGSRTEVVAADLATSGAVRFTSGRVGRTTNESNIEAVFRLRGTGQVSLDGLDLVGNIPLIAAESSQTAMAVRDAVSRDRGDTSVTLVPMVDKPTVCFRTPLAEDRRVFLSPLALNGSKFRIVRTGLGPGRLDVGGLKTIPAATAAFVEVQHDGTAWLLTGYGTL